MIEQELLAAVFSYIEQHLNIPAILDAAAVGRGHVDERSMLTYLSFLYNVRVSSVRTIDRSSEHCLTLAYHHYSFIPHCRASELPSPLSRRSR